MSSQSIAPDEEMDHKPKKAAALDGGWGWMVVLGCSLVHVIMGGTASCFGLVYQYLIERFNGSAALTASIHGISAALRFGLGPVASAAVNYLSARKVVIMGSIVVGFGFILSAFPPNLIYLFFTYTLLYGAGSCFALIPSIIEVGLYFDKKRGVANGISTAGAGIGQFAFPLLFAFLQENYGYFGAMLILGGISFNMVVGGALYRPLVKKENVDVNEEEDILMADTSNDVNVSQSVNCDKILVENGAQGDINLNEADCISDVESKHVQKLSPDCDGLKFTNSLNSVKDDKSSYCLSRCCDTKCKKSQKKSIDFKLLLDPVFFLLALCYCFCTMGYILIRTFIPALVESRGYTRSLSAQLLAYVGGADMTGRLLAGFIFDLKRIRPIRRYLYNIIPMLISIVVAVFPSAEENWHFICASVLFGFLVGMFVSQRPCIIADVVGMEKFSDAFGLVNSFQGLGLLIGPPVGGALRDHTGQYDYSYYFASSTIAVGGFIFLCQNLIHVHRQRKAKQTPTETGTDAAADVRT